MYTSAFFEGRGKGDFEFSGDFGSSLVRGSKVSNKEYFGNFPS